MSDTTEKAIEAAAIAIAKKAGFAPAENGAQWSISYAEAAIAAYMAEIGKDDGLVGQLLRQAMTCSYSSDPYYSDMAGLLRAAAARIAGQDGAWVPRAPTEEMIEDSNYRLGYWSRRNLDAIMRTMDAIAARPKATANYPETSDTLHHGGSASGAPKEPT